MNPTIPQKYQEALKLRLKGKSYREIYLSLGVPKSTLSSWFKNLTLPPPIQKILKKKGRVARAQLMEFNRCRTETIKAENRKIEQEAFKEIHLLSKYELMLIGAALYWTEGHKIEKQKRTPEICFANSDPYMVALFMRFLREIVQVPEEKFRITIHIYPNIDTQSAIRFWTQVTNVPEERFYITQQISRASKRKRPFNSLPFGTLKLAICERQKCFQIKGWIDSLKNQSGFK